MSASADDESTIVPPAPLSVEHALTSTIAAVATRNICRLPFMRWFPWMLSVQKYSGFPQRKSARRPVSLAPVPLHPPTPETSPANMDRIALSVHASLQRRAHATSRLDTTSAWSVHRRHRQRK